MSTDYQKLKTYCDSRNKNRMVRNYAYCIYVDAYETTVNDLPKETPRELERIKNILLSPNSIERYVKHAESLVQDDLKHSLKPFVNSFSYSYIISKISPLIIERRKKDFWGNVLAGIVASLLFSVTLIIIFALAKWIAKDQIVQWLNMLIE